MKGGVGNHVGMYEASESEKANIECKSSSLNELCLVWSSKNRVAKRVLNWGWIDRVLFRGEV